MRNESEYCLKKEKMNERKESERCPSFEALVSFVDSVEMRLLMFG